MKIYVAPNGVGLGHITRTIPIVENLVSKGAEVVFSTYLDGLDYAKAKGFKLVNTVPITFIVQPDGTVDFKQTAARSGLSLGLRRFLKQVTAEIKNIKRFKPDIVFSDSRASSIVAARLLGIPIVLMLNQFKVEIIRRPSSGKISIPDRFFFFIANIFWLFVRTLIAGVWAQSKLILVPDFPYPNTISINNLAIPKRYMKKVRLIGPIVSLSPRNLPNNDTLRKELHLPGPDNIVYIAISGPKVERNYLTNHLLNILDKKYENFLLIISCGIPNGKTSAVTYENVIKYEWIDDQTQFKVLKLSDVVVSRSGHGMITKALTFGKPMILIPTPDHTEQYGNAHRLVQLGVALMLEQKMLNTKNFYQYLEKILCTEYKERTKEFTEIAQRLNPIVTAADLIIQVIKEKNTAAT